MPPPKPPEPPSFALPRGGRARAPWRFPALALTAATVTLAGAFVVKARLERDPLGGVPAANRAEISVRSAEAALSSGDLEKAEASLTEALAHLGAALELAPGDLALSRGSLAVLDRRGQLAVRQNDPQEALRYAKRAADLALDLRRAHPGDERACLDALATANTFADRGEAARIAVADLRPAVWAAAIAVGAGEGRRAPAVALVLGRTWMRLARLAPAESEDAGVAWAAAVEAVAQAPAQAEALSVFAAAADAAERRGDLTAARSLVARALALSDELVAAKPADPGVLRSHEARLVAAAERAERAADRPAAARWLTGVVSSRRARLQRVHPADAAETRRELSRALSNLGAFWSAGAEREEALSAYEEAVSLSAELTGEGRRTHLTALGNLAVLQGKLGRWDAARVSAAKAAELAVALSEAFAAGEPERLDRVSAELRWARLLHGPGGDDAQARRLAHAALARLEGAPQPASRPAPAESEARRETLRSDLQTLIQELR